MIARRTALGLAATALVRPARADLPALEAAARREGAVTWYVAQLDGQTAEAAAAAFRARHPGIEINVVRTTGQVSFQRLQQDLKNNAPQCDVFSSTDLAHYPALMAQRALARYEPEAAAAISPAFQDQGEPGYVYPTTATLIVLASNTRLVPADAAPRSWRDLLDPRWRNQVAVGHPGFSGFTGAWVLALVKLYGWAYFEALAQNRPLVGRSAFEAVNTLNAGERKVGSAPLSGVLLSADKGNPVLAQYPEDGGFLCVGPSAVLAPAPHPNAARLLMEFLLGPEFARVCVAQRVDPVRADVPPRPGSQPLLSVKLLRVTTAEITAGLPDAVERWRDLFG